MSIERLIRTIKGKKSKIDILLKDITEIENSLSGMEMKYNGQFATINFIDGNTMKASIYLENEDKNVVVPFDELLININTVTGEV